MGEQRRLGKALDEVFVRVAQHIGLQQIPVAQRNLGEVGEQALHQSVHGGGIAEAAFVIEADPGEHAAEVAGVRVLDGDERLVDGFGAVFRHLH